VELAAYARREGRARTVAGAPVPDARVVVVDGDGNTVATATTEADGSYVIGGLPVGEYTVIASGYPPAASKLTITPSQPHHHEVRLGHPEA
jgi:uncharacterized surface anchored protein